MSAASDPVPRKKSSKESRPGGRRTLFLPVFILLLGLGTLEVYQVMAMEDQLDDITQTVDKMDPKVKVAEYERAKFFKMAHGVLVLADHDPNASQVATYFKLKEIQIAQPELMNMDNSSDIAGVTNAAPADASAPTNASPAPSSLSTNAASTNAAPGKSTSPATP